MAYEFEVNQSRLLSDIIDPSKGRTPFGGAIEDLLASAGLNLKKAPTYGSDGYSGGQGFERVAFNAQSRLSAEDTAANKAALESFGADARLTGTNVLLDSGKPGYINQVIGGDGTVRGAKLEEYKKIKFGDQLFDAGIKTFLGAAFAGAAGFGPLGGASGGTSFSAAVGKIGGTVGKSVVGGAIQGGVNSAIAGGDFLKGVTKGAVSGGIGATVSPVFGTSLPGRIASGAVTSAGTAAATGGDPLTAGVLGAIGGANLGKLSGLDGAAATFVNQLAGITAQQKLNQRKTKGG